MRGALLGLALAALLLGAGCTPTAPSFRSTDVTGASFGRELSLADHAGRPRTLADFRGKAVVVFFGFTHCPDVCPTALATIKEALERLGPDKGKVQVLFVTVDPERDTRELLSRYVTAFDPSFLGLTGSAEEIARAAQEFKVFYQKVPGTTPGAYTVDHSTGMFVFDPQGRLRLFAAHGQGAEALAHDLGLLLRG